MATGTLVATYELRVAGIVLTSTSVPLGCEALSVAQQPENATHLTVRVDDNTQAKAEALADRVAAEVYRRLLLRHGTDVTAPSRPRRIRIVFTASGASLPSTDTATIYPDSIIVPRPPTPIARGDVESILRESHIRATTPPMPTSAQLYAAIDMFLAGIESGNSVVRFVVLYSALSLAALFNMHSGRQGRVDELIRAANPTIAVYPNIARKVDETLYTKLRNDLIHAEERGCDPGGAIQEIERNLRDFQRDAAAVLLSL